MLSVLISCRSQPLRESRSTVSRSLHRFVSPTFRRSDAPNAPTCRRQLKQHCIDRLVRTWWHILVLCTAIPDTVQLASTLTRRRPPSRQPAYAHAVCLSYDLDRRLLHYDKVEWIFHPPWQAVSRRFSIVDEVWKFEANYTTKPAFKNLTA
ncbi:hypothetical protein F4803DRAFT_115955 [Xylaria telfairii]|nr:hypothetical protein F4803DRAFT_115955 [Xylaria telfairii]